ncbi:response regulator [Streptomyces albulus]|nr:response regulator [Streptomyces noursei]
MPGLSGRILVVDDNKVIRQLIRVNLELEGFEVVTAADGAECLDVVHRVRPDVVTLDVMMPRLGGLHTAARLRSDPRTWDIPIAIVSACTQGEVDNGQSVGIDAFLAKPFEPTELVRTVGMLVREGRQQRECPGREACGGASEGPVSVARRTAPSVRDREMTCPRRVVGRRRTAFPGRRGARRAGQRGGRAAS